MFDTVTRRPVHSTVKRLMTVAASLLAHVTVLGFVVLIPLWYFTPPTCAWTAI